MAMAGPGKAEDWEPQQGLSYESRGTALGLASTSYQQGARLEVRQQGPDPESAYNAGITGSCSTYGTTTPTL